MGSASIVTALGIVVSASVALAIAAQNRKQQRHLEAFKLDPSIGLKPPPTKLWVWWSKKGSAYLVGILVGLGPSYALLVTLERGGPIVLSTVVLVALNVSILVTSIGLLVVLRGFGRQNEMYRGLLDIVKDLIPESSASESAPRKQRSQ